MRFAAIEDGRYIVRLDPGEDIVASLRKLAADEEIVYGWVTGLGSTSQATLGFLDPDTGEYVKRRFDEPMEVSSLTGSLTIHGEENTPVAHVHVVLAPRELISYSGHLHEGKTGAIMELFLQTSVARVERHPVEGKPFLWPYLPGEDRSEARADADAKDS